MRRPTPRLEIDLAKIRHNTQTLRRLYAAKGIHIMGVTKAVCGAPEVAHAMIQGGLTVLADSRIENIQRMRAAGIAARFVLLRTLPSRAEETVLHADISLNSELATLERLAEAAQRLNRRHDVILMVELGDLREGILPENLFSVVRHTLEWKGIRIAGLGANLACFGGIRPDAGKMETLSRLARNVEEVFDLRLEIISGGNSANYDWFSQTGLPGRINNLRIGESILLGCETLQRRPIPGLYTDAFRLVAEVIELKTKPSVPQGVVCQDSYGNVPKFEDRGPMRRALLGIGRQDVIPEGLSPEQQGLDILGASGDHLILDAKTVPLRVGDEIGFRPNYGALVAAMTSPYVTKKFINA